MNLLPVPVEVPRSSSVSALILDRCSGLTPCGITLYGCAPCRNRTYNLMIKSQLRASDLTRTGAVYLGFQATNDAELVPPVYPKRARSFPPKSHGRSSIETAVRRAGHIEHAQAWTVTGSPPLKAKGPLLDHSCFPPRSYGGEAK